MFKKIMFILCIGLNCLMAITVHLQFDMGARNRTPDLNNPDLLNCTDLHINIVQHADWSYALEGVLTKWFNRLSVLRGPNMFANLHFTGRYDLFVSEQLYASFAQKTQHLHYDSNLMF